MWDTTVSIMMWVVAALLIVANAGGVVAVIFQLPGTWIMLVISTAYAVVLYFLDDWSMVWLWVLGIMLALAILGEVIETVAGAKGARKAGGTKTGAVLAVVGGIAGAILGTIFIPIIIVGTVLGACLGAGLGAGGGDMVRGRSFDQARLTGQGAAIGKLWGTMGKVAVALVMWMVATVALFLPG